MANLLYALMAAATASSVSAPETPRPLPQSAPDVEVSLISIRELRILDLEEPDAADEDEMFFIMSGEEPSLALEWRIALPQGSNLIAVTGLRDVQAADSTGRDLTPEDLEYALDAQPRYEFGESGEAPEEVLDSLTLTLALPDRKAESFSLTAQADATVSTGSKELKVALTDQWQTLAAEDFGGQAVRIRLNREMGETIGVEFSPADAAERAIESMRLNVEGDEVEDSGSMSDSVTITYFFDAVIEQGEPANLTMTIRTGLQTIPIRFELKDQELP